MFQDSEQPKKKKEKLNVKESFLIEFDKKYLENCDNNFMSRKMRGVSNDNPFE